MGNEAFLCKLGDDGKNHLRAQGPYPSATGYLRKQQGIAIKPTKGFELLSRKFLFSVSFLL